MEAENSHLSDQELLQSADGELSAQREKQVRLHLAACWSCRSRLRDLENTISDFVRARSRSLDAQLPPSAGPRALLKAQLAANIVRHPRWSQPRSWMLAGACFAVVCLSATLVLTIGGGTSARTTVLAVPRPNLTPGSVVLVGQQQVCSAEHANNRAVPISTQRKVFEAYGIPSADARGYEVDYLVSPALGGSDDIHNLWPQSYGATAWNAHVKDELEERLRDMVCSGDLDLATAQREISQDWIAAYKKYFRTDQPLNVRQ